MRAAVLSHPAVRRQQARRRDPAYRVLRLRDEGGGLSALGLLGHRRIGQQLGQPARRAEPHLQRINRIGPWFVILREVVTCGLLAQIEHQIADLPSARPALVLSHSRVPSVLTVTTREVTAGQR